MQNNNFKIEHNTKEKGEKSKFLNVLPCDLPVSFSLVALCFTDRRTSVMYISI